MPASRRAAATIRMNLNTKKFLAWGVHLYTGLGLLAAAGMAVLIVRNEPVCYRYAFFLMLAATLIDATDGTLARLIRVKEVLPGFDGRRLDDLIDFLTFTSLPLFLIWRAGILSESNQPWLLLPFLASAYGFCQVQAKTDDGFFLGFPSYWNIVAFYLYVLRFPEWLALTIIITLSILTFVPSRYLYPTQRGPLNVVTCLLGAIWAGLLIWILVRLPASGEEDDFTRRLALISFLFPIYYLIVSWAVSLRKWKNALTTT